MASYGLSYRFKDITIIPNAKDLIDIVLSKTQRKTPTQVHPQFQISRIRSFYMRKVKFCQQVIHDKISLILSEFPKLDEIHPFYSDLCNVLYDRDHYKLALGQLSGCRNIIDSLAKDYVRLLKYADNPYKCKMLKKAAIGRMCTSIKKLQAPLEYLEEVRQHIGRLPSINPTTRTIIVCGYPNVGKSSFVNSISQANVEVEPYAFTTKSLYVGHFDYEYTRWQVIDTPGILDRPLDERNTIEMTAITALAHIYSSILYFIDISEECGYSIEEQVNLFHSIKVLFKNKPILIAINKIDVRPLSSLTDSEEKLIKSLKFSTEAENLIEVVDFVPISTLEKSGVDEIKNRACDILLQKRVNSKIENNRVDSINHRLYISSINNDNRRPPFIPESVTHKLDANDSDYHQKSFTEKDLQELHGGPGVYQIDYNRKYLLKDQSWNYDILPEIFDGKNILDFVDRDILNKLSLLEKEEEVLSINDPSNNFNKDLWNKTQTNLKDIHQRIKFRQRESIDKKSQNKARLSRGKARNESGGTVDNIIKNLEHHGYETDNILQRSRSIAARNSLKRARSIQKVNDHIISSNQTSTLDIDMSNKSLNIINKRPKGHSNALNRLELSMNKESIRKTEQIRRKKQKYWSKMGKKGEADRTISIKMPMHLYSGKRSSGKTDRR